MDRRQHVSQERLGRLDELLGGAGLEAVWLATPNGFAWLTGGDNVVERAGATGIAAAGYDGDQVTVVTTNIEADRLRAEEVPAEVVVESYDWYAKSLAEAVETRSATPAGADFDVPGFADIDPKRFRQPLTQGDRERYRALGEDVAATLGVVCRGLAPDDTERAVSARLRGALAEQGIDAQVSLVGGGRRARSYRHYTPTDEQLDGYVLVSVSAMRDGLVASCTRTVAFDPPAWLRDRHEAASRVEATALAATRDVGQTGGTAREVFSAVEDAYKRVGWDGEWTHHHQGGAAGYAGREWIATPALSAPVHLPMAYAWNPTVQGAKSEGTVLVTADGFESLTDDSWPTHTVDAVGYEQRFERPDILVR